MEQAVLCRGYHFGQTHVDGPGQSSCHVERHATLATLDQPDAGSVQTCLVTKALERPTACETRLAKYVDYNLGELLITPWLHLLNLRTRTRVIYETIVS
ncbi:hypothetical protein ASD06_05820 [Angustibacter sp. Root456]|nr:hypothetical protein [Angustibacter sp. Root456]KQX65921.1 hypothetical protein ASD06_05820 [Angustibacter sp. Root456]